MRDLDCADVRELLPELAAGVAPGDERAAALAHLATCPACREELGEVAATVDELLLLAPEHEPPAGFDLRVIERLTDDRPTTHRTRNAFMLAAGFLLVVGAAVGVTWAAGHDDRELADDYQHAIDAGDGHTIEAAAITADGNAYGRAYIVDGDPSWVFLTMKAPGSGRYPVRLVTTDGRSTVIGICRLKDGAGSWGTVIDVPTSSIASISLERPGYATMVADFA